jgi:transposase
MTTELVIKSIENACLNAKSTKGIILHSDLGTQYTSQKFKELITNKELVHSFSRKGNPYYNACIESFHSLLKRKRSIIKNNDFNVASRAIFEYIESWYNRKRIHGSINDMVPHAAHEAAT